jgi:hypothetical protein
MINGGAGVVRVGVLAIEVDDARDVSFHGLVGWLVGYLRDLSANIRNTD